jgi:hypothetical protein
MISRIFLIQINYNVIFDNCIGNVQRLKDRQ